MTEWGCEIEPGKFDLIRYSSRYCEIDTLVLKQGHEMFRSMLLEDFDIDLYSHCTIASVADRFYLDKGVYNGVVELRGGVRDFIARANIGGRVMMKDNTKHHFISDGTSTLDDLDAVSLYPSAQSFLDDLGRDGKPGGILKGVPKVWTPDIDLNKVDGFFVEIEITKVGKEMTLPCIRLLEDTCANWTNGLEGHRVVVDRVKYEDLHRFQEIKCNIIKGYYFDQGRNPKIGQVARYIFTRRAQLKKEGNPLQEVFKLIMNSAYGKTSQKPISTDVHYIEASDLDKFTSNNFDRIVSITPINDDLLRAELFVELDKSFNRVHVSCEILSMSKRLVNQVSQLFDEAGYPVHYTDTDSLHVRSEAIEGVAREFEKRYGRKLMGKGLGQFHCDFTKIDGSDSTPVAIESVFLAKKTYCDVLRDKYGNEGVHFRMKRVPAKVIRAHAKRDFGGSVVALYRHLYTGVWYMFDLQAGGNCTFKTRKDHSVHTLEKSVMWVRFL
eukprot:scaffold33911_cov32-Tisochrysis_lutea.AAC.6